jgi:hypothetical protein
MISDVINIRMLSKELGAVFKIDMHGDTIWFGGLVGGDASEEPATQLQRRDAIRGTIDDIG